MEKYFNILKKSPLFENIRETDLTALLSCLGARTARYSKKALVMSEGDPAREFGIVLSGAVQIMHTDYMGNRTIVAKLLPSQLFAEAFACAGLVSLPLDVVAADDCEIMFISCSRTLHSCCNACEFHSRIIYNLMKSIAEKNIIFHRKLRITSKRSTREKLLEYLNQQSHKVGSHSFDIPYDRQELADYLEVDRSGLSAEISKLRAEGIIESDKKRFTLLG